MSSTVTGTIDHHHDHTTTTGIPNKKLLMWAFLASDCMFFGSLISTHLVYRLHPPPGNPVPREVFDVPLTSFSTFILLMSSLMMALAVNAIQKGNLKSMRFSLLTTIFFGSIFLGCQVFEFTNFVHEKHMTITNSILGTTFYTLTGTHGTHVAIGVLWLIMMYVRSFKPADTGAHRLWFFRNVLHVAVMVGFVLSAIFTVLAVVHTVQAGESVGAFAGQNLALVAAFVVTLVAGVILARPHGPVQFSEVNAIDVESMGLYWHFVDIVWIVIFTAVYLLEYL
ncbi:MAG: cytochrome oxidase subunit [Verrucomicrobia bacterium]|nr:cytochrome oxidase subunit [Verrucomicrobiota bacterium]